MAAPDLGQRPPRRQAGGDRDREEVEHIGELGLHRTGTGACAPADPYVGRQEARGRGGDEQRDARPAGRGGQQRRRAGETGQRGADLHGHDVVHRHVEPRGGDALPQPARRPRAEATPEPHQQPNRDTPAPPPRSSQPEQQVDQGRRGERAGGAGEKDGARHRPRTTDAVIGRRPPTR